MEDKDYLITLGKRIISFRKQKKLKQSDLANLIGIEETALSRIENGRVNSTINMLRRIANSLNINVKELLP